MNFKNILLAMLLGCVIQFFSCATGTAVHRKSDDLKKLVSWMTGSFSSQEQAQTDHDFLDIRLKMVKIWPNRQDGYWLYVEQALATKQERPYRQRVYHVTIQDNATFESAVYTLEDPLQYAGEWQKRKPLAALTPESLIIRKGCSIILKKEGDEAFAGSTQEKDCVSTLRGAEYATSEVRITPTELVSWDRGFDHNDIQVWGAETGGYIFKKIEDF
ncbi:chromophore lyase CpcT/CpeT [candidate division CSSED10-310 bacterium]|uniref:Chromophore lyase CpcT/CpeT n=1 Tax=candidate division CSSED10-310 bacterium TaxID=2855610 RepID=A0ABV6YRH2_UNCC1